jgi:predicted regulator of Ras-like GTPase activity (Roadblock/LC7/MglB family)
MTIPFLDIFKKWTDRRRPVQASTASVASRSVMPSPTKTGGERLSKTVMPNTTRTTTPDFFKAAGDSAPNVRAVGVRALPPTVALALQPRVERGISLELTDLVDHVPVGFLKPAESFDLGQSILLKASEIEQGMADGKPAVSLYSVYEQVPDIFLRTVRPDDATQISVPHAKVLDQLRRMQIRDDQETENSVPQVDTPILKVAMEDTQRFGTKTPTTLTSDHPRVRVEPPTARAFSNAEPEAASSEKVTPAPIGVSLNLTTPPKVTPRPSAPDPVAPTRIPFKLPSKGTDEPASERVPASSSSSVPLSVPVSTSATRIPFKMTPPSDDLKPKLQIVPGSTAAETAEKKTAASAVPAGAEISLGLRPIVQNMPSFQLHRSAESVAPEARIALPLALVESQLASGRIAIPIKLLQEAVPAEYKEMLVVDAGESPVLLPLQEVLKNLSPDLMKMRDDQVLDEVAVGFETPFSIKAAEDAKRFSEQPAEEEATVEPTTTVIEAAKTPESKQPEAPKAPDSQFANPAVPAKQVEIAKIPEAKEVKVPEATQPVVAKVPEAKLVEKAKGPDPQFANPAVPDAQFANPAVPDPQFANPAVPSKQLEKPIAAKPAEIAKPLEAKPAEAVKMPALTLTPKQPEARKPEVKLPEISKPELKLPERQKLEAKQSPVISEPVVADKAAVLKIATAQPEAIEAKPPVNILKPPGETRPAAAIGFPAAPKAEPKPEIRIEPALKLKAEAPNEFKPAPVAVPAKPATKPEQKPDVNTNAKAVVEEVNALPGVAAAAVMFEDGLSLAGKLPDDVQAGGLCAMAPSILQRINRHTVDTKFGPLVSTTLTWRDAQLSFFMTGTVCLAALHSQPVLPAETHRQLAAKVTELSRIYAQPGEKHVHH